MPERVHRHQAAYPVLWRAVDGAIRDAVAAHPDIQITDRRRASIVKRVVGSVLALAAGAGKPAETAGGVSATPPAIGADARGVDGAGQICASPTHFGTCHNCGGLKPEDRFRACPDCRAEWRARSRKPGGPAEKLDKAAKAVRYLLDRSQRNDKLYYEIGYMTEAFRLLTEAHAALTGTAVDDVIGKYRR